MNQNVNSEIILLWYLMLKYNNFVCIEMKQLELALLLLESQFL